MDLTTLPLQMIAEACNDHTSLYYQKKQYNPDYCFELFRRALQLRNNPAFDHLYRIFLPQVMRWIYQHPSYRLTGQSAEDFAQSALMKFYFNLKGSKFEKFSRLDAILQYLKACIHSTIRDFLKKHPPNRIVDNDDNTTSPDPDPDHRIEWKTLMAYIESILDDEEFEQFIFWIIYNMKPSKIVEIYPEKWSSAQEISRLRQKIKRKLQSDARLKRFLDL